jgi:hypothetical protein
MKCLYRMLIPFLLLPAVISVAQTQDSTSLIFLPGEELQYSVRWQFIRLGTITISRIDDGSDPATIRVSMLVESNPSIPFVDIREYNESLIDATTLMTMEYYGDYRNRRSRSEIRHIYDYENNAIYHYEWDTNTGRIIRDDTVYNASDFVNGPSLFSYSRARSASGSIIDIPTYVRGEIRNTRIDFTPGIEDISISAWPYPVRVRKYKGTADWEGGTSQGLSGDFSGWISDDFAAIPVRAEMKVMLGSIRIELESWDRPDWTPSTAHRLTRRSDKMK